MNRILVAAGVLSAAFSAHADVQLAASLAGLQVQLIDLDPLDGIAPAVTWLGGNSYGAAYALSARDQYDNKSTSLPSPFQAVAGSGSSSPSTAVFVALGSGDLTGTSFEAKSGYGLSSAQGYSSNYALAASRAQFSLTPHTRLVFSAWATTDVSSSLTGEIDNQVSLAAFIRLQGAGVPSGYQETFSLILPPRTAGVFSRHKEERLSLVYVNTTSGDLNGELWARASVQQTLQPIPEPTGAGLLLAGIGLVAALARRRRDHVRS